MMRATRILTGAAVIAMFGVLSSPAHAQKRQREVITRDEIIKSAQLDRNVYDVVQSLRPFFLQPVPGVRSMSQGTMPPPALFVDGHPMQSLRDLRDLNANEIDEVRFMDPGQAMAQFGQQYNMGAVSVKRRRPGTPDTVKRDTLP